MARRGLSTTLLFLFLIPLLSPMASAGDGGLVIDENSIVIAGSGEVGGGSIWVNLSVVEVDGSDADGSVSLNILDGEGAVVASVSEPFSASASSTLPLSLELAYVPPGVYALGVELTGDVASAPGVGQVLVWNSTCSRLRPLDIGLASPSQWTFEPVDLAGTPTGNASIRSGDSVNLSIPVINSGDVDWEGGVNISIEQDGMSIDVERNLSISADESTAVDISIAPVEEGELFVNASLSNITDSTPEDDSLQVLHLVAGPPAPSLRINLTSESIEPDLGQTVVLILDITNHGEATWHGRIICESADGGLLLDDNISVAIDQTMTWNISTQARPGESSCQGDSTQRVDSQSQNVANHSFQMTAGDLVLTGGEGMSVSGGPWHVGDIAEGSILVHNKGEADSTARLWIMDDVDWTSGPAIDIPVGSSMELTAGHPLLVNGTRVLEWKVLSGDSLISEELSGDLEISVESEQALDISIGQVSWDAVDGISIDWEVTLEDGPSRLVEVSSGLLNQGVRDERINMQMVLQSGKRSISQQLGLFEGQGLAYVDIDPVGWGITSGGIETTTLPSDRPSVDLSIEPISRPARPQPYSEAVITCLLDNDGPSSAPGTLMLIGNDGTVHGEKDVGRVDGQKQIEFTIESWPEDEDVPLTCRWNDGDILTASSTFLSDMSDVEDQSSSTIPLDAIGTGFVVAIGLALVIRLGATWRGDSDQRAERRARREEEKEKRQAEREKNIGLSADEKVEIKCSNCDQGLKVPASYGGTVSCPACKHQFMVEASFIPPPVTADDDEEEEDSWVLDDELDLLEDDEPEVIEEEIEDEEETEQLSSSSNEDILGCPSCSAKLRVPLDKRPATARCPACRTEFRALAG